MELSIRRIDSRAFLGVGSELIEISDYKISSSMQGGTELEITIPYHENIMEFSTSATQEESQQQSLRAKHDAP